MLHLRARRRAMLVLAVVLAVSGLGVLPAGSPASMARKAATYDGRGVVKGSYLPKWASKRFLVRFHVSRTGTRVTNLHFWFVGAGCHLPGRRNFEVGLRAKPGSAVVGRNGTFKGHVNVDWPPMVSKEGITFTGRFKSRGRATGTLRFRGTENSAVCAVDGTWTARVMPPPPPYQRYAGTTAAGTQVTFQRTVERHPRVRLFDFGELPTNCGSADVRTTWPPDGPPYDVWSLPVTNGSFKGDYHYEVFGIGISGRFRADGRVSGTVSYGDRGDCGTGEVRWSARPVGRPVGG